MKNKILKHIAINTKNYDDLLDMKYSCRLTSMDDVVTMIIELVKDKVVINTNNFIKRGE